MEIKVIEKNYDDMLAINRTKWNLANKKSLFLYALYTFLGLLIWLMTALPPKDGYEVYGWAMGFGLIFFGIVSILRTAVAKGNYLLRVRAAIAKSKARGESTELILKDDCVILRDFETYCEIKWSVFSSYMLHGPYLLLIMENSVLNSIAAQKKLFSEDEFAELINFCKGHLYLKK